MKKLLILVGMLLAFNIALAQTCPRGEINDPYPGQCGQYIDENANGYCDQSEIQEVPAEKSALFSESKAESLPDKPKTNFTKIWILSWIMYITLELLAKKGKVSPMLSKKIFNAVLLISFVICAITSFAYLLRADYGYNLGIPNLYELHLQSGIWLIGISVAHLAWHWQYYLAYLKK